MKRFIVLLVCLAVLVSSCQKEINYIDNEPAEDPPVSCMVDSVWLDFYGARLAYTNTVITGFNSPSDIQLAVQYDADKRPVATTYTDAGVWLYKKQWVYNAAGQVAEEYHEENMYGTPVGERSRYQISYENGKRKESLLYYYNTLSSEYVYSGKLVYKWTADNLTLTELYDAGDGLVMTTNYQYDITKLNTFADFPNFSFLLLGTADGSNLQDALFLSKNIMISATESDFDRRDYKFEYLYNSSQQISHITAIDMDAGATEWEQKFFYKCN